MKTTQEWVFAKSGVYSIHCGGDVYFIGPGCCFNHSSIILSCWVDEGVGVAAFNDFSDLSVYEEVSCSTGTHTHFAHSDS